MCQGCQRPDGNEGREDLVLLIAVLLIRIAQLEVNRSQSQPLSLGDLLMGAGCVAALLGLARLWLLWQTGAFP